MPPNSFPMANQNGELYPNSVKIHAQNLLLFVRYKLMPSKLPTEDFEAPGVMPQAKRLMSKVVLNSAEFVLEEETETCLYLPGATYCPHLMALPDPKSPLCRTCTASPTLFNLRLSTCGMSATACENKKQDLEEIISMYNAVPFAKDDDCFQNFPYRNGNLSRLGEYDKKLARDIGRSEKKLKEFLCRLTADVQPETAAKEQHLKDENLRLQEELKELTHKNENNEDAEEHKTIDGQSNRNNIYGLVKDHEKDEVEKFKLEPQMVKGREASFQSSNRELQAVKNKDSKMESKDTKHTDIKKSRAKFEDNIAITYEQGRTAAIHALNSSLKENGTLTNAESMELDRRIASSLQDIRGSWVELEDMCGKRDKLNENIQAEKEQLSTLKTKSIQHLEEIKSRIAKVERQNKELREIINNYTTAIERVEAEKAELDY